MLTIPVATALTSNLSLSGHPPSRSHARVVLIASSDASLRERLRNSLTGLRWQVVEAEGGAAASWEASQLTQLEALVIDSWLPDLEVQEFLKDFHQDYPEVDVMMTDGVAVKESVRSPYHQELLYALRRSQEVDTAAWMTAPAMQEVSLASELSALPSLSSRPFGGYPAPAPGIKDMASATPALSSASGRSLLVSAAPLNLSSETLTYSAVAMEPLASPSAAKASLEAGFGAIILPANGLTEASAHIRVVEPTAGQRSNAAVERIPELIGSSPVMLEVSRRIRLVAGRTTPVLIEGPTGSGKEVVAEALHRLSKRSRKPFVAINCAAIPEALLEAELFGHTRGAFTGAVQGRIGRIESADGGTLFLDEIGEMPLALQSKLLRFFESGELQRIGDNEIIRVDVRIISATHQPLAENAQKGSFRADLYYRLAVFLIHTPALAEHMNDLPLFVAHIMERMGRSAPVKRIDASAMFRLASHGWPGNVRELEHVLERAAILAGDEPLITASEIDFGLSLLN